MTALIAPWLLPSLISAWTSLVFGGTSWQLARHMAIARIAGSAATIAPLTLGIGLFATFGMVNRTVANVAPAGLSPGDFEGIVILIPIGVIAAVGSIAVVMMAARQHCEDIIAMRSAGATRAGTDRVMLFEALIVAISAVLVAVIPLAIQYALLAYALGVRGRGVVDIGFDPVPAGVLVLVALAGMLVALLWAERSAWRRPLSDLLADR